MPAILIAASKQKTIVNRMFIISRTYSMESFYLYHFSIRTKVLSRIETQMNVSKCLCLSILKNSSLTLFYGCLGFLIGDARNMRSLRSMYSFCLSVSKFEPPAMSYSVLNVLMTTATNRLRKKKHPTIINTMQKIIQPGFLWLESGTMSTSVP